MKQINKKLENYIKKNILPEYAKNDSGHNLEHINYVFKRSMKFAQTVSDIDYDMVYTIVAYHDIGYHIDPKNHEKVSAEILEQDQNLRSFFTEEQIKIMSEAIYDHRASLEYEPRSIYGKIVSSANRNTEISKSFTRTYTFHVTSNPERTLDDIVEESRKHLLKEFGDKGYATEKMYFDDQEYRDFLKDLAEITHDKDKFKEMYFQFNGINDVEGNMLFLFDELQKNPDLSLDQILYYTYIKLNTTKPFYEIKREILRLKGIDEYSYYTADVDKSLVEYVENNIFPKYELNDHAHGIIHIKEVIRRIFALNATFKLNLNPNMLYAISACHDIDKYIDSDIHEKLAAAAFQKDENMRQFFSDDEITTISEAIFDHRSGKEDEPRSIYGKLISSADRNTTVEMVFIRSFFVALGTGKKSNRDTRIDDYLEYTWKRLSKRYDEEDPENMFFEDDTYRIFLTDMRNLLSNPSEFKRYYCEVNSITDTTKLVKDYEASSVKRLVKNIA